MSKTAKEIYKSMKKTFEDSTECPFDENSKYARALEALSTELYGLYCYGDYIRSQAFVQSASGESLERLAALRGVVRKAEQKATGKITFYLAQPAERLITIPKGTICSVSGKPYLQFVTATGLFIVKGSTSVTIPAEALTAGSSHNVSENEIDVMVNAPVGVSGVYNSSAFTGGYDTESDESLRMRVIQRYAFDPCGVNAGLLESTVINLEFVTDCFIPRAEEAGAFRVYAATKNGALSEDDREKIRQALAVSELLGTEPEILLATPQNFSIDVRLKVRASYDRDETEQKLRSIVNQLYANCRIGGVFSLDDIEKRALLIDGVLDASAHSPEARNSTVYCDYGSKLIIKNLAVSYYEA